MHAGTELFNCNAHPVRGRSRGSPRARTRWTSCVARGHLMRCTRYFVRRSRYLVRRSRYLVRRSRYLVRGNLRWLPTTSCVGSHSKHNGLLSWALFVWKRPGAHSQPRTGAWNVLSLTSCLLLGIHAHKLERLWVSSKPASRRRWSVIIPFCVYVYWQYVYLLLFIDLFVCSFICLLVSSFSMFFSPLWITWQAPRDPILRQAHAAHRRWRKDNNKHLLDAKKKKKKRSHSCFQGTTANITVQRAATLKRAHCTRILCVWFDLLFFWTFCVAVALFYLKELSRIAHGWFVNYLVIMKLLYLSSTRKQVYSVISVCLSLWLLSRAFGSVFPINFKILSGWDCCYLVIMSNWPRNFVILPLLI